MKLLKTILNLQLSEQNPSSLREVDMTSEKLEFRKADKKDIPWILKCIQGLADYENMSKDVVANEDLLEEWIFDKNKAEVLIPEVDGKKIGFILYFYNFSTFQGRAGIYLEDLFIFPEYRNKGYGRKALKELARIAVEEGCGRLEWVCLDWNKPAIQFYESMDAQALPEWVIYRLSGESLEKAGQ